HSSPMGNDDYSCGVTTTTPEGSSSASAGPWYSPLGRVEEVAQVKTDREGRKLMSDLNEGKSLSAAARAAGMSENTARRYRDLRQLPSESRPGRTWRTRGDAFDPADWAWVVEKLRSPEGAKLQAKVLFRAMRKREDVAGTYTDGQLRSFQRRVRRWRAQHGPEKE